MSEWASEDPVGFLVTSIGFGAFAASVLIMACFAVSDFIGRVLRAVVGCRRSEIPEEYRAEYMKPAYPWRKK